MITWLIAGLLVIVAAARLTRLVTQDSYPPVAWLRSKWDDATADSDWNVLLHCHWCLAPWMVLPLWLATYFALADHRPEFEVWHLLWLFIGWMALSYPASWIVNNDEGLVIIKEGK